MTYQYAGTVGDCETLIQDVVMDKRTSDHNTVSAAMGNWKNYGSMLLDILRPAGQGPSAGYISNDTLAPQSSIQQLVDKYLPNWSGPARDELLKQTDLIRDFGFRLGKTMYDPSNPTDGNHFYAALGKINEALSNIQPDFPVAQKGRQDWLKNLSDGVYNFSYNGLSGSNPAQNCPGWTNVDVNAGSYQMDGTATIGGSGGSCVLTFTVHDGVENGTLSLPGTYSTNTFTSYSVDTSKAKQSNVQDWLNTNFTKRYMTEIGPMADMITADATTGRYIHASQLIPNKLDASNLPHGTSSNQPGGSSDFGGGGGLPTGPGGHVTPLSLDGTGTGPKGPTPLGLDGTGTGAKGPTPLGLNGDGLGGAGGGTPGGNLPTQLAGLNGGGSGSGLGPGGVPLGGGPGGVNGLGGLGPGGVGGPGGLGGGLGGAGSGLGGPGGLGGGLGGAGRGLGGSGGGLGGGAGGLGGGEGGSGLPGSYYGPGALGAGAAGTAGLAGEPLPMMPPMIPPGMAGSSDNSRQRKSWLPEDDNIWTTDDAAVPPVISSDL